MLAPLTSLRFFAAFGVMVYHMGLPSQTGGLGVMFFFMLSGFIMSLNYGDRFISLSSANICNFYLMRAARIFPIHLVTMVVAASVCAYESLHFTHTQTVLTVFLLNSWFPGEPYTYNFVAWTLSVELFFYVFTPFILWAMHASGLWRNWICGIFLAAVCWAIRYSTLYNLYGRTHSRSDNVWWWFLVVSPYMFVFLYLMGVGLGSAFLDIRDRIILSRRLATLLEGGVICVIVATYLWSVRHHRPDEFQAGAFAFAILLFALGRGAISALLSRRPFVLLGEISFCLYMVHQILIRAVDELLMWVTYPAAPWYVTVGFMVMALFVAWGCFLIIEEPARKSIRKLSSSAVVEAPSGTTI